MKNKFVLLSFLVSTGIAISAQAKHILRNDEMTYPQVINRHHKAKSKTNILKNKIFSQNFSEINHNSKNIKVAIGSKKQVQNILELRKKVQNFTRHKHKIETLFQLSPSLNHLKPDYPSDINIFQYLIYKIQKNEVEAQSKAAEAELKFLNSYFPSLNNKSLLYKIKDNGDIYIVELNKNHKTIREYLDDHSHEKNGLLKQNLEVFEKEIAVKKENLLINFKDLK